MHAGRWHCAIKTPWSLEVEFHKVRSYLYCGRAVFFSLRWSECPCWILYCSSSPKSYQAIRFIAKLQLTIRSHSYIHSTYLKLGDADGIGDGILIESSNKLGKLNRYHSIMMWIMLWQFKVVKLMVDVPMFPSWSTFEMTRMTCSLVQQKQGR